MAKGGTIKVTSTATGNHGPVTLSAPVGNVAVSVVHDSTKQISWKAQGSHGDAGVWTDLMAATSSTGSSVSNSTATGTWTKVRIQVTGNQSTGDVTSVFQVVGR